MRVQTAFEKIAQATNGRIFGFCFVSLRILLGVLSVILVSHSSLVGLSASEPTAWMADAATMLTAILGASLIFGLLVRPAAVLAILFLVLQTAIGIDTLAHASQALPVLPFILLLGMFAAGGAGHAFGLDGIILRNIRRPGKVAKFLFG